MAKEIKYNVEAREMLRNVLAAVDFDLKFTYVLAGWEGSAHDATILADALERQDGLKVPEGNNTTRIN